MPAKVPMFVVATLRDHVAPWRSVYKVNLAAETELTFLLTSGGHNAGIVSEPGHPRRSFQYATRPAIGRHLDPDQWLAQTPTHEGSWWPTWEAWLRQHSDPNRVPPPYLGNVERGLGVLTDAPGEYVHG